MYFTYDLTPSCCRYTNQWFKVWLNIAVHYGITQKSAISKNWRVYRKHSLSEYLECAISILGSRGLSISDVSSTKAERFIILHKWKILQGKTSNNLNILFVSHLKLGNLAVIPSKRRTSSTANLTLFDNSFAVQGPKLWNVIPYHLNVIQDLEHFKDKLTKFMLSLPDKPPIRGYTPPNTNSLLCWRNERDFTSPLGESEDVMAPSSLDETKHRSHRLIGRYHVAIPTDVSLSSSIGETRPRSGSYDNCCLHSALPGAPFPLHGALSTYFTLRERSEQ